VAEKIERAIRQNAGLIAGQILEGASEASGEGAEGDESATGFAEDGAADCWRSRKTRPPLT
jgi:hypothetical protein